MKLLSRRIQLGGSPKRAKLFSLFFKKNHRKVPARSPVIEREQERSPLREDGKSAPTKHECFDGTWVSWCAEKVSPARCGCFRQESVVLYRAVSFISKSTDLRRLLTSSRKLLPRTQMGLHWGEDSGQRPRWVAWLRDKFFFSYQCNAGSALERKCSSASQRLVLQVAVGASTNGPTCN